jgi:hypothetical protein
MIGGPLPEHAEPVVPPIDVTHWPPTQPLPVPHACPHAPQFALSFCVSTQAPAHAWSPGKQPDSHAPPEHTWLAGHFTPQPPQLFGSWLTGMHVPPQRAW